MKIAIVADIHHGKPHHTKRGDAALELMEQFCDLRSQQFP